MDSGRVRNKCKEKFVVIVLVTYGPGLGFKQADFLH